MSHNQLKRLLLLFVWLSCAGIVHGQTRIQQKLPEKTRILFLLDASGSMQEQWERPNQSRWTVAKRILTRLVDSLKQNNNLELGLRIYGHLSPQEVKNCKDTRLEVPFRARNHQLIVDKLEDIRPKGVTPITYSLEQAAHDFPAGPGYRNIVILITDGIESCGGDLCATSRALQKNGVFLRPYIIGLGLQSDLTLECAGKYIDASTPGEFYDVLNDAIQSTFARTTVSIELLDGNNKPTETNVNVTFVNNTTGIPMYDFVHYRDSRGNTDSVQVDPVVDYDIVVNTIPPVVKRNVEIEIGRHTVVPVMAAQGALVVRQDGRRDLQVLVRTSRRPEIINTQNSNEEVRYLTGKYTVETLTLPRRNFDVEIQADKTREIVLPAPGVVNFNTIATGYGSLYELNDDGMQTWVCDLNERRPQFSLTLLPGRYKIVFRVKQTKGSKYTAFKTFALPPGKTLTVSVFN